MITTDAMTKTHAGRLLRKIFTSHVIARVRKGCVGFYCERELETEHNRNILTPKLWPSALCLSRSLGLLNRSPGVHSAGCWLSLLHLISNFSGPQTPSGFPSAPSASCGFSYHISSFSVSNSPQLSCLLFNSSAIYYLQTPTRWYGHASTPPQFLPISGDRDVSLPLSLEWPVWSFPTNDFLKMFPLNSRSYFSFSCSDHSVLRA